MEQFPMKLLLDLIKMNKNKEIIIIKYIIVVHLKYKPNI